MTRHALGLLPLVHHRSHHYLHHFHRLPHHLSGHPLYPAPIRPPLSTYHLLCSSCFLACSIVNPSTPGARARPKSRTAIYHPAPSITIVVETSLNACRSAETDSIARQPSPATGPTWQHAPIPRGFARNHRGSLGFTRVARDLLLKLKSGCDGSCDRFTDLLYPSGCYLFPVLR